MNSIHITTARLILNRPEPVDIRLWTSKGEIQEWHRCICIKYDHYKGIRKFKLLDSNQIRQTRECCIFMLNGMEVYMWKLHKFQHVEEFNQILFRTFAARMRRTVVLSFLLPLLTSIRSTLIENEAALLSCILESGKFIMQTRRSTTVHVYTWACRLIVFLHGIPEPEYWDCGIRKPTFYIIKTSYEATVKDI